MVIFGASWDPQTARDTSKGPGDPQDGPKDLPRGPFWSQKWAKGGLRGPNGCQKGSQERAKPSTNQPKKRSQKRDPKISKKGCAGGYTGHPSKLEMMVFLYANVQIRHESVFVKSWLSEAQKSPKCSPMGANMEQKTTKKTPKTHPKNNFEKRCLKNVLWESFGAVLGSPWVALCTSEGNCPSKRREEGARGS